MQSGKGKIPQIICMTLAAAAMLTTFCKIIFVVMAESWPFSAFVVTKMDLLDPDLVNSTRLDRIVKRAFPQWFEGRLGQGGRITAICPISALGYGFMDGGPFTPVNAEKPLLAALKVLCGKTYGSLEGVRFYRDGKRIDGSERP